MEEDQTEWVAGPYDDDVDHDEEAAYGVEAMCRIIAALHAKATMPTALQLVPKVRTEPRLDMTLEVDPLSFELVIFASCEDLSCCVSRYHLPQYLAGADWRQRRAGLCALGALADSATKAFKVCVWRCCSSVRCPILCFSVGDKVPLHTV